MLGAFIGIGAAVIALLTFVSTQLGLGRAANRDYVKGLEDRVRAAEERLLACETARTVTNTELSSVREENLWLTRQLLKLQRDGNLHLDDSSELVRRAQGGH